MISNGKRHQIFELIDDQKLVKDLFFQIIDHHESVYIWKISLGYKKKYKVFITKNYGKRSEFSIMVPRINTDEISYFVNEDQTMLFFIPNRKILFESKILMRSIDRENSLITFAYPSKIAIVERRRDYRFNLEGENKKVTLEIPMTSFFSPNQKIMAKTCIDLSLDGLSFEAFKSEQKIFMKKNLFQKTKIYLSADKPIEVAIKIENSSENQNKKNYLKIGCTFVNIAKEEKKILSDHLLMLHYSKSKAA